MIDEQGTRSVESERQIILVKAQESADILASGHRVLLRAFPTLETRGLSGREEVVKLQRDAESLIVYLKQILDAIDKGFTMEQIDQKAAESRQLSRDARNSYEGQS